MAAKRKQRWEIGSLFLLPLKDGTECLGQIVGREPQALNSVSIVLFDAKGRWSQGEQIPNLDLEDIFSAILVTRDLLDSGRWPVIDQEVLGVPSDKPYEHLRSIGFIGAKIRGSANVEEFANAYYGLMPWDDWYIPNYLDDFLVSPSKKPHGRLVFSGRHGGS